MIAEDEMPSVARESALRANFRNSLRTVGERLEVLLPRYSATSDATLASMFGSVAHRRHPQRPRRSRTAK